MEQVHALLCYDFRDHDLQLRWHRKEGVLLHAFFILKVHLFLLILKTFSCPPKRAVGVRAPCPVHPQARGGADSVRRRSSEAGAESDPAHPLRQVFGRGKNKPVEDALPLPQLTSPFHGGLAGPPNNKH